MLRVLLVDDMHVNRDIIGGFLRCAGHVVVLADSGASAAQLAAEQTFNLVLMDVAMPGIDGLAATRLIRALPGAYGKVRIMALTFNDTLETLTACAEAGMDKSFKKLSDYDGYLAQIRSLLGLPLDDGANHADLAQPAATPKDPSEPRRLVGRAPARRSAGGGLSSAASSRAQSHRRSEGCRQSPADRRCALPGAAGHRQAARGGHRHRRAQDWHGPEMRADLVRP